MNPTSKPLPSYILEFLEYCEIEKGLTPNTSKNYKRFLQHFFSWLEKNKLQNLKPHELTENHIWQYRLWLSHLPNAVRKASKGLKIATQSRYLIALRTYLAYFHEKNIPSLPTEKVKLPKENRERQVKFLELEQLQKLLEAPNTSVINGLRDRAILEALFSTGLRVAELVSLDHKNFTGIRNKTDFEISVVGKGGYPRTVYFSERALEWLKKYLTARTDKDPALFIRANGPRQDSLRLTVRGIELVVQKYAKQVGIPILATPHTLRHSFATDLLNQGVDLRIVQEFLGHRNIATTQVYTHVTSKRLRDIHKKFHGGKDLKSE